MSLHRRALTLFFSLSAIAGSATGALAYSDATQIPLPPYVIQPAVVLLVFLAIFVGAAWSLSTLMGFSPRPIRLHFWKWRRHRI